MSIMGCDLHTRYQVVAFIEEETGEIRVVRLEHASGEVRSFYARWPRGTVVGVEATFPALWFEQLLSELGHELWVGDAARIRASEVRQQKTDARDAEHLLDLLRTGRFPHSLMLAGAPLHTTPTSRLRYAWGYALGSGQRVKVFAMVAIGKKRRFF